MENVFTHYTLYIDTHKWLAVKGIVRYELRENNLRENSIKEEKKGKLKGGAQEYSD